MTDLEQRILARYWHEYSIFQHAQAARIESVMLSCLAVMNALAQVLGYEPEGEASEMSDNRTLYEKEFISDRNTALSSLNRDKILAYYRKWGDPGVADWFERQGEQVFWGSVYKAITAIPDMSPQLRKRAREWLARHGMSTWG